MSSIQVGDLYVQADVPRFYPGKHNHFVIDAIAPHTQTGCWVDVNAWFCTNSYDIKGCEPGQIRLEAGKMRPLTEIEVFELHLYCLSINGV